MKEKNKKRVSTVIVVSMLLVILASVITPVGADDNGGSVVAEDGDSYTIRDPIRINGNSNFASQAAKEGWPGDGNAGNPYIIEGYEIDAEGYGCGIYVGNTTKHFVIRGCYIYNASKERGVHGYLQKYYLSSGISLYMTRNGRLEYNTIRNHQQIGIVLWRSDENHIEGNKILSDRMAYKTGIDLWDSNHNTIIYNNISRQSTGIALVDCLIGNAVHNNTFTDIYHSEVVEVFSTDDSPTIGFLSVALCVLVATFIVRKKKELKR